MSAIAIRSPRSAATKDPGEAVSRLFVEHSDQILGYCLHQLRSRTEAEDATQTTFLYALRALRRGVVPECESAWLTTIAKNVCHSERRTVARRGPLAPEVELDTIPLAQTGDDEEELLLGFREALASMPERQRRALVLREWQGVPSLEIARELGLSATATHALLTRARHSFAQALTVARQPALGLAWLAVELRSHVKALLGGVSTKAAVTSIAVIGVGAGVGGIAVDRGIADSKAPPIPARSAERTELGSDVRASPPPVTRPSSSAQPLRAAKPTTSDPAAVSPARDLRVPGPVQTATPRTDGLPERTPEPAADTAPLEQEPPVEPPVTLPQLPDVGLPTLLVPPVPAEPPSLPVVGLPEAPALPSPSEVPSLPTVPLP